MQRLFCLAFVRRNGVPTDNLSSMLLWSDQRSDRHRRNGDPIDGFHCESIDFSLHLFTLTVRKTRDGRGEVFSAREIQVIVDWRFPIVDLGLRVLCAPPFLGGVDFEMAV